MRWRRFITVLAAALTLSGCVSTVNVKKITLPDTTTRGMRFSLPVTFLLVQPQADGTATYSWVYLPDPDRTYVLNKKSFLAKFTLDVATANGLLTSVQAQGDSGAATAKLFEAAQSVYSAKISAASKADTAETTSSTVVKAAVTAAQLTYDQAVAEKGLVDADASATASDKRAAAIKLSNADLALKQAQATAKLKEVAFDMAGGADSGAQTQLKSQYGPVLFRVMQNEDGTVQLLAMNNQDTFDTVAAQMTTSAPASTKIVPTLKAGQKFVAGKNVAVQFTVPEPIADVDLARSNLIKDALPRRINMKKAFAADRKTVTVTFLDMLQPGKYSFTPALIQSVGAEPTGAGSIDFTVNAH